MKIFVISDLRVNIILTVLFIYKSIKNSQQTLIVISKRVSNNHDSGDFFPPWYKKIKIYLLQKIYNVKVIDESSLTTIEDDDIIGILSSLCSITNDSLASKIKYPNLYKQLENLTKGAKEVCSFLDQNKVNQIYVFNGRTSSSEAVVRYCLINNIQTTYYEFGRKYNENFLLMDFPIHNAYKYGLALVNLYNNNNNILSNNEIIKKGKLFSEGKINNNFTKNYILESEKAYDIVIFLGSDHEYTNIRPEIIGMDLIGNYELCRRVLDKYGADLKYAVRAHPNQQQDPSCDESLAPIIKFCSESNIDFFGPNSTISSYSLIKKSKLVAVEISSVAVDAIILEREVDVFGNNDLKAILDTAPSHIKSDKALLSVYVCEVLSLSEYLFQYDFNFKYRILSKLLYRIENEVIKRIDSHKYIK